MPVQILMPALSPTMTHGKLSRWKKKKGEHVKPGDVIAEIETDKAIMEVEAVDEGVLGAILVEEGTEGVAVNSLIAIVLEDGESDKDIDQIIADVSINANNVAKSKPETEQKSIQDNLSKRIVASEHSDRVFASPLARRLAAEKSIDLKQIQGSGPHNRIVKDDVLNFKSSRINPSVVGRNEQEYQKIPVSSIRKIIASRLLESKQTIPHYYLQAECVIDQLLEVRLAINANTNQEKPEYKLSINDFIIKASALALKNVPEVNCSWGEDYLLQYNNVDISIAVSTSNGLITPIIRNADQKSIIQISNEMKNLAQRARTTGLKPEEFQGGGFSISNLGMFGISQFKAIINPPQSAILAVGSSDEKVIVKDKNMVIGNVLNISISCDHRIIDGALAAKFLGEIKKYLENPILLFL